MATYKGVMLDASGRPVQVRQVMMQISLDRSLPLRVWLSRQVERI